MKRTRSLYVGVAVLALMVALGIARSVLAKAVAQSAVEQGGDVPRFEVDPMWPKPLPNNWVVGAVIGVAVDAQDHIWIVHRPSTLSAGETLAKPRPPSVGSNAAGATSQCCVPAPPIIEFDEAGNMLQAWGGPGPGYEWPTSEHGLWIDFKGNVWTAGSGDNQVLKFTQSGKFLLQIGRKGQSKGNNDTENLDKPADIDVDPKTNEVYVADGYGNRRIIVFDADTGAYKRHWGAYGRKPDDVVPKGPFDPAAPPPQRFGNEVNGVHCVRVSNDGLVYVCDRQQHRIQIFHKDGSFVREVFWANRPGDGRPAWDIDFSPDPAQTFLYDPDAENAKVWIFRRATMEVVGFFGRGGGHFAGQFYGAHSLAVDRRGNVYVGETYEGKRVQKFVYKGM